MRIICMWRLVGIEEYGCHGGEGVALDCPTMENWNRLTQLAWLTLLFVGGPAFFAARERTRVIDKWLQTFLT
jgi:hypothetical protein